MQKNDDELIIEKDEDGYNIIEDKRRKSIFDILNKNKNILYKHIKEIDDLYTIAENESKDNIFYYSIGCACLGILGFMTSFILPACKKKLVLRIAENFKKVINDEEKNKLLESNSDKINEGGYEINIPFYSIYGNINNIKEFGNYYLEKYSKELKEEGLNGLAKNLIDLINCYNNSINSRKDLGKLFNN